MVIRQKFNTQTVCFFNLNNQCSFFIEKLDVCGDGTFPAEIVGFNPNDIYGHYKNHCRLTYKCGSFISEELARSFFVNCIVSTKVATEETSFFRIATYLLRNSMGIPERVERGHEKLFTIQEQQKTLKVSKHACFLQNS